MGPLLAEAEGAPPPAGKNSRGEGAEEIVARVEQRLHQLLEAQVSIGGGAQSEQTGVHRPLGHAGEIGAVERRQHLIDGLAIAQPAVVVDVHDALVAAILGQDVGVLIGDPQAVHAAQRRRQRHILERMGLVRVETAEIFTSPGNASRRSSPRTNPSLRCGNKTRLPEPPTTSWCVG